MISYNKWWINFSSFIHNIYLFKKRATCWVTHAFRSTHTRAHALLQFLLTQSSNVVLSRCFSLLHYASYVIEIIQSSAMNECCFQLIRIYVTLYFHCFTGYMLDKLVNLDFCFRRVLCVCNLNGHAYQVIAHFFSIGIYRILAAWCVRLYAIY